MSPDVSRRIRVLAPYGTLTHEIRLSQADGRWQARIITLPGQIWVEPGGRRALTFESTSAARAEEMATQFVQRDCIARGHRLAGEVRLPQEAGPPEASRRRVASLPVRLMPRGRLTSGMTRKVLPAVTHNLSETGLFIVTRHFLNPGARVAIELKLPGLPERLEGVVIWARKEGLPGGEAGLGIRLLDPPLSYRVGLQSL
jgi:hypothetical protein